MPASRRPARHMARAVCQRCSFGKCTRARWNPLYSVQGWDVRLSERDVGQGGPLRRNASIFPSLFCARCSTERWPTTAAQNRN